MDIEQVKRSIDYLDSRHDHYVNEAAKFEADGELVEAQATRTKASVFKVHKEDAEKTIAEYEEFGYKHA